MYIAIYHLFIIHSSICRHLGCFYILATVNNAAMNIGVHISFWISVFVFFRKHPEVELLDCVVLFLIFWGTSTLFHSAAPIYIPTNRNCLEGSPFSPSLPRIVICCLFDDSHSDRCEVILWFWFAFLWWLVMLSIFSCVCRPSVCLFWKNVYSDPLLFFNMVVFLFVCFFDVEFFVYFGY